MERLVNKLQSSGVLRSEALVDAFQSVDRADFLTEDQLPSAYQDRPLPIGEGQTNSQPSTVAFMLEVLQPETGDRVLDVGSGSGWTTALLAHTVGENGEVIGVERIPSLVEFGRRNIAAYDFENASIIQAGDVFGLPDQAPFDKILVSAAAEEIPEELVDQLNAGGRMVVAVQHSLMRVDKLRDGSTDIEEYPGFMFVPLKK